MKKCSKCKKDRVLKEFNFRNKALGIRQRSCRECTRQELRNHYRDNKDYYIKKARIRNIRSKKKIQFYKWNYLLENPCIDCGENDPIVLDFDHKNDKIASVSDIIRNGNSLEKVKNEMDKCEVRCANCHRRKTAKDFDWYKANMPA